MTVNALTRLQDALAPGSRWLTVENTKIPENRGQVRTVTKGGKTTIHATLAARGSHSLSLGHVFNLPTRVSDVEWLDADTARYALRRHAAPHELVGTVTIRRVPEWGLFRVATPRRPGDPKRLPIPPMPRQYPKAKGQGRHRTPHAATPHRHAHR